MGVSSRSGPDVNSYTRARRSAVADVRASYCLGHVYESESLLLLLLFDIPLGAPLQTKK